MSGPEIVQYLTSGLAARTNPLELPIPPSTTLAIALDCGEIWRFITLGDTGIRLNGDEVLRHEKLIDSVFNPGTGRPFSGYCGNGRKISIFSKKLSGAPSSWGWIMRWRDAVLDRPMADQIISQAILSNALENDAESVSAFLNGGITNTIPAGKRDGITAML